MKRCVIDPVLALEDEKLGGREYRKVFRDAKLAIARAFKVIERFYYHLFAFHMSFSALTTCFQSPHLVHSLTHSALYIDIECCFFMR